jgi:hypothetical protein
VKRATPLLIAGALLLPVVATAQTVEFHTVDGQSQLLSFNRSDCDDEGTRELRRRISSASGTRYFLTERLHDAQSVTGGVRSCPGYLIDPGETILEEAPFTPVAQRIEDYTDVPVSALMGADACGDEGVRRTSAVLCLYLRSSTLQEVLADGIPVDIDTDVPGAPAISALKPGDSRASFSFTGVDDSAGDAHSYFVQLRPCSVLDDAGVVSTSDGGTPSDGGVLGTVSADSVCNAPGDFVETEEDDPNVTLTGLTNDVRYELRVRVRDDLGNMSETSPTVTFVPSPELGPLDLYDGEGSPFSTTPDCSQGGGLALPGLAALLLLGLGWRRRGAGALLSALLAVGFLGSAPAYAGLGQMNVSLRVAPYKPALDTERVGGARVYPVYGCFFDDAILPEVGADIDVHLFDELGSLELTLGVTGAQASGKSRALDAITPADISLGRCGDPADGSVELSILKVRPALTYRFDPFLEWIDFPLVPYGRLGLVAAGYAWTREGQLDDGGASEGNDAMGLVFGWEAAFGLSLALDFWDYIDPFTPYVTQRAQANGIFEHAYIYGELVYQPVDNFGAGGFVFSPSDVIANTSAPATAHFGLMVEFP